MPELTGCCLCGAVRYLVRGTPFFITHCHCEDCRRASGAPFVTWASSKSEDFLITRGTLTEHLHAHRTRGFCSTCGTTLTFRSSPAEIDFTVASLDHPASLIPEDHTWTEDRLPWIQLADALPTHLRSRP